MYRIRPNAVLHPRKERCECRVYTGKKCAAAVRQSLVHVVKHRIDLVIAMAVWFHIVGRILSRHWRTCGIDRISGPLQVIFEVDAQSTRKQAKSWKGLE